ncbi:hypothetical protein ACFW9O_06035 [Streptomyces sp. NPDC059499]|uniref:hypothetical protein n=1 Tax=Streptomyces sp. NPDC059499 TaxID=3346852 RepID=UPI00367A107A
MPLAPLAPLASELLRSSSIPVDLTPSTPRPLYLVVTGPLRPGDQLDITADARVTNDCGRDGGIRYTVGVGWHLWAYTYVGPGISTGPWWRISHSGGDNVSPDRHHLPLHISRLHTIPEDWPPGDRMVVVLQADAHSTAWAKNGGNDLLTCDAGYGQMIVRPLVATPTA